ncbi:MAG: HAMP domain-containing histidine kinase [Microscillaceae bacterium]|nr:HAMP domain-containing histidine kinase [Microscillaceae bacterium]MDW8461346.1 HAMP domain-containing sensor histidine kinase [Cytophagales bacterium]
MRKDKKYYEELSQQQENIIRALHSQLQSQQQDLEILNKAFEARREYIELRKSISEKRLSNLIGLSKYPEIQSGDWRKTSELISKTIVESLRISHCSLWYYNYKENVLYCTGEQTQGIEKPFHFLSKVSPTENPIFFQILERENIFSYDDLEIENDPRLETLKNMGFTSILFVPIRLSTTKKGFIFCANAKNIYTWEIEDFIFLKSIRDVVVLSFESYRRAKIQKQVEQQAIEIKEKNEKLMQINAVKDKLFSIVAHDLRAPISNLKSLIDLLENNDISYETFTSLLPEINKNLYYTNELIENLLAWARDQMEGIKTKPINFNIIQVIKNTIELLQPQAQQKNLKIITPHTPEGKLPMSEVLVYADIDMVKLIIRNLLSNAIKFTYPDKKIFVDWTTREEMFEIVVKDEGIGIEKEKLAKLFTAEHFSQRGTNNEKGTGLGLRVCKDFAERNGGSIRVESELGVGSSFYFTIPMAVAAQTEAETQVSN